MVLDPARLQQFRTAGYTTVPDFFAADETAAMRAELGRLVDAGKLRNVATEGDGATHSSSVFNLQICPLSPHSELFRSLKWHPRVIAAVQALIGDPVVFRLDQIFLKPPRHGAGTSWHQDNAYWHQPHPERATGMWIALHDATVANGTMHIVPGSHGQLERHVRDPGSDHHIYAPDVREEEALPIELPAGGVLFFNWGILHCTRANTTERERAGLALHFANGAFVNEDFWGQDTNVRLTGAGSTDGLQEEGVRGPGSWERAFARARQPALAG